MAKRKESKSIIDVTASKVVTQEVKVTRPNLQVAQFQIVGTSPYCQHKFGTKTKELMRLTQEKGSETKKGMKKPKRNFEQDYKDAIHFSEEGWMGIPASAFRNALIDAHRLTDFKMTHGKCSLFCLGDGLDSEEFNGLVRIKGEPEMNVSMVRLSKGVCSLAARPIWKKWSAEVNIRFDADQYCLEDVTNLMIRVGIQIGLGEGRHFSKTSNGLGWGCFEVAEGVKAVAA